MTVGELIRELSVFCPDTPVELVDGNLLTSDIHDVFYGDSEPDSVRYMDDGQGGDPETLYLLGE